MKVLVLIRIHEGLVMALFLLQVKPWPKRRTNMSRAYPPRACPILEAFKLGRTFRVDQASERKENL